MRRVIPFEKKVESRKGIDLLNQTCDYINEHLDEFENIDYENLTELCLYLLTGHKRKKINTKVFEMISSYIKDNMGKVRIDFSESDTVHRINIGNIKMGSLSFKDFSDEELQERVEKKLNCCGNYPTMDRKERMFLTLGNNFIVGNQATLKKDDYDNIFIGPYYLNRNTISKNSATLTKLEYASYGTIKEDIYVFNEDRIIDHYDGILAIDETKKENEFIVTSSMSRKELFHNSKYGINHDTTSSLIIK